MRIFCKYTGQEFDEEVDLHNFRARFYDSDLMRFYAVDPAEEFYSPYLYCGNNPINLIDPTGEESVIYGEDGIQIEDDDLEEEYERRKRDIAAKEARKKALAEGKTEEEAAAAAAKAAKAADSETLTIKVDAEGEPTDILPNEINDVYPKLESTPSLSTSSSALTGYGEPHPVNASGEEVILDPPFDPVAGTINAMSGVVIGGDGAAKLDATAAGKLNPTSTENDYVSISSIMIKKTPSGIGVLKIHKYTDYNKDPCGSQTAKDWVPVSRQWIIRSIDKPFSAGSESILKQLK